MIKIEAKYLCCGCGACEQKCPLKCIQLIEDDEGFLYPSVDESVCVNCELCQKVCPIFNKKRSEMDALVSFAVRNPIESERMQSSSGGLFIAFAKEIIRQNGIVFGARFTENFELVHDWTDNFDQLLAFMKSKYVQSKIGRSYKIAQEFLKEGRKVLFVGTPCQVAGLYKFLNKRFDNLYTIDIVCHGVPSPGVWRTFVEAKQKEYRKFGKCKIQSIQFREKIETGWRKYSFVLNYNLDGNVVDNEERSEFNYSSWGKPFVQNLFLRPSCHQCSFKSLSSGSDLTISDFWGIENIYPLLDDDKGVSALIVNTTHGQKLFEIVPLESYRCKLQDIIENNKALVTSCDPSPYRTIFFNKYKKGESILSILKEYSDKLSLKSRIRKILKSYPYTIILLKNIKRIVSDIIALFDLNLAIILSHLFRCRCNGKHILLIPADSLSGGFGEDIMVAGFLKGCHFPVTILENKIEPYDYITERKNVVCKLGLIGYFPCLSMLNEIKRYSDLYVIGADIMDGIYTNNRLRFAALQMAHNMGVEAHITGFSIRKEPSDYFKHQIRKVSKYMKIKVRDLDSYNRMRKYVDVEYLQQTADIAFLCGKSMTSYDMEFLRWVEKTKAQSKRIIAYCPNTIQAEIIGLKQYVETQILLLRKFEEENCCIAFLYHDLRKYALGINDKQLSYMIYNYFQVNGFFIDSVKNGVELKKYIEVAEFTVTGRMHFGISGYTLQKPMFGVCYFNKFEGLQKMFGIDPMISLINYENVKNELEHVTEFMKALPRYTFFMYNHLQNVLKLAQYNY